MKAKHFILPVIWSAFSIAPSLAAQPESATIQQQAHLNFRSHVVSQHLTQRCANKFPVANIEPHKQPGMSAGQWVKGRLIKRSRSVPSPYAISAPGYQTSNDVSLLSHSGRVHTNTLARTAAQ